MNSRERLLTAIAGDRPDHIPLLCWCFGFAPPLPLRWKRAGREIKHWYTGRLEHLHTLPEPWTLPDDDFERVQRWLSLGLDDVVEVSVPWDVHPAVRFRDWHEPAAGTQPYGLYCREYDTPAGRLLHSVRDTREEMLRGWVIQPDRLPLVEDFNIPRGVKHAVAGPDDLAKVRYLLCDPTAEHLAAYRERMACIRAFAQRCEVLVQGWSGFGMDLVVWLMGVEAAVVAAMTQPDFFQEVCDIVSAFDLRRTEIMLEVGSVDVVAQRGWYSSVDFWSPRLFKQFLLPQMKQFGALAHGAGARYAYVMTMGVATMAEFLAEAEVDLLYFADPVQDRTDLADVKARLRGRPALAGGVNSALTLGSGTPEAIRLAVHAAAQALGPDGYIMAPVDALFPDTPWTGVESMIEAWKEVR